MKKKIILCVILASQRLYAASTMERSYINFEILKNALNSVKTQLDQNIQKERLGLKNTLETLKQESLLRNQGSEIQKDPFSNVGLQLSINNLPVGELQNQARSLETQIRTLPQSTLKKFELGSNIANLHRNPRISSQANPLSQAENAYISEQKELELQADREELQNFLDGDIFKQLKDYIELLSPELKDQLSPYLSSLDSLDAGANDSQKESALRTFINDAYKKLTNKDMSADITLENAFEKFTQEIYNEANSIIKAKDFLKSLKEVSQNSFKTTSLEEWIKNYNYWNTPLNESDSLPTDGIRPPLEGLEQPIYKEAYEILKAGQAQNGEA